MNCTCSANADSFHSLFYPKQVTQPTLALVVFCLCFFLRRPNKKENIFHSDKLGEGE